MSAAVPWMGLFTAIRLVVPLSLEPAGTTLSACHALHHSLHHDSDDPGHFCLVCSFAKGQVSATEASAIPVVLFLGWLFGSLQAQAPLLPGFDYRLSPSRAPPRS